MTGHHRAPFRFIDRVVACGGGRCVAVKEVSADEVLLDRGGSLAPAYPVALVIEALAQAALPLAVSERPAEAGPGIPRPGKDDRSMPGLIVAIRGARVLRPLLAGDRLRITAEITGRFAGMIRVRSMAEVDGAPVAEGEFTIAVDVAPGDDGTVTGGFLAPARGPDGSGGAA